jgi:hypothetical protein
LKTKDVGGGETEKRNEYKHLLSPMLENKFTFLIRNLPASVSSDKFFKISHTQLFSTLQ